MSLKILPRPKKVVPRAGRLDIAGDVPLWLSPLAGDDELTAARAFAGEARRRCRARLPIEKPWHPSTTSRHVRFLLFDRDRKLAPELAALPRPRELGDQGYVIDIDARRALVAANAPRGLFHAAQTLRQICGVAGGRAVLPACRIVDWPDFGYRGVMLDVSRFKVPTLETMLWLTDLLASMKINVFQLYIEHPFQWRKHPAVWKGISPFTAEEILLLDRHCRALGIELQANQQSFGHHNHLLTRPGYGRMSEVPSDCKLDLPPEQKHRDKGYRNWSFSPVVPESYKVIGELYDEVLPLYSPRLFNADCDETFDLGMGRAKKLCERRGTGRVYVDHILRLHKMAAARGKRLMIWGDILLHHPELIRALPKDLLVLDWGYDAYRDRRKTVSKFAEAGLEFWVCPGVATWSSVFARTDVAQENIRKFAEAGKEYGASGLLNTDWGDGGHPNLQGHSLHGYACGAEQAWTAGESGDADFDTRFAWAVFRDGSGRFGKLFRALGRTNAPFGPYKPFDYDSYPFAMVWEGFSQLHSHDKRWTRPSRADLAACGRHARTALDLIADLRREFPKEKLALDECELAARQTLYGLRRYPLHKAAADALGGVKRLTAGQRAELRKLRAEWRRFRREFERLWMARSKRSQISYRLGLYRKLDQEYGLLLGAR